MKYLQRKRFSEVNVQAELYRQLKNRGHDPVLEYKIKTEVGGLRADVIIRRGDEILCAIEVKWQKPKKPPKKTNRQFLKYEALGIPWRYCRGYGEIESTVNWIDGLPEISGGKP
jgi:hypothetical protein